MDAFPAFFPLHGATIIIVGEGEAADAKARLFDGSPAQVVRITGEAAFSPDAYQGAVLAFIAQSEEAYCLSAAAAARKAGVPVNVVDRPELCDFTTPAVIDRGPVVAAIGTGGSAPLLASQLRADIEARIPPGVGKVARLLKDMQSEIRAAFPDLVRRRAFLRQVVSGPAAQAAMDDDLDGARSLMRALIAKGLIMKGCVYSLDGEGSAERLSLKAARLLSEADILVLGERANSEILALARRDAERLDAGQTEASALMAVLAKGLCIVLIGAPSLAMGLAERGESVEALPVADG